MTTAQPAFGPFGGAPVLVDTRVRAERTPTPAAAPVFVDTSGRRRRALTALGYVGAAACAAYVTAFGVTLTSSAGALDHEGIALTPTALPVEEADDVEPAVAPVVAPRAETAARPATRERAVTASAPRQRAVTPASPRGTAQRPAVRPRVAAPRPVPAPAIPKIPKAPAATTPTTPSGPGTGGKDGKSGTTPPATGSGTTSGNQSKVTTPDPATQDILA